MEKHPESISSTNAEAKSEASVAAYASFSLAKKVNAHQQQFDTYKHVATLSSALIVIIASFASKVSVPIEGVGEYAFVAILGLSIFMALSFSVLAMYLAGEAREDHSWFGKTAVFSFALSLLMILGGAMYKVLGSPDFLRSLAPAQFGYSIDSDLYRLLDKPEQIKCRDEYSQKMEKENKQVDIGIFLFGIFDKDCNFIINPVPEKLQGFQFAVPPDDISQ